MDDASKVSHAPLPADPSPVPVSIGQLRLDDRNPRLPPECRGADQDTIVRVLWQQMAVDEVAFSIAANGYWAYEPLFVIPHSTGQYVVVEGNRRLAAVRLLRETELREQVGATDLPAITPDECAALDELPAILYPDRESLWTFLGYEHIKGVKPWDSFSKAQFISQVHEDYGIEIPEIARRIGDRHETVAKIYLGFRLLRQAQAHKQLDLSDRYDARFKFSHLYTAASQPQFREFLGITEATVDAQEPVPADRVTQLGELMHWLYGSRSAKERPEVRTQSPDLNLLRQVVSDADALAVLRDGKGLEYAFRVSQGDSAIFEKAVRNARDYLQEARRTVYPGYGGGPELLDVMGQILELAQRLRSEMADIQSGSQEAK